MGMGDDFAELAAEFRDLERDFSDMAKRHGPDTARDAIEDGVKETFEEGTANVQSIEQQARNRANRHVPSENASNIEAIERGWSRGRYFYDLTTTDTVVASHEWGTGTKNINNRGTVNAVSSSGKLGYLIPNPPWPEKRAIKIGNNWIKVRAVVHPGVSPKRFMWKTIRDNVDNITLAVGRELSALLRRKTTT